MIRLAAVTSVLSLTLLACGPTIGEPGMEDEGDDGKGDQGGGAVGPDASCPSVDFMATQVIPSIQLLIDRSGSMAEGFPGSSMSRYQAMREALVGTNGVVQQLQSKAYFGASLYSSDSPCPRLYNTATRAKDNFAQVKQLIESQGPSGNTPTPGGIDQTVANFAANPAPMGSPPIIVLATDGLPNNCAGGDTQNQSVTSAENAYNAGIRTFVLGIAGVNDGFLQRMANAGQGVTAGQTNAKFYTANSPQDLQLAFQQIIGNAISCELALSGTVDPEMAKGGVVNLNGMTLTYGVDWDVVNGNTIRLLGNACTTLKNSPNPQVKATFSCGAILL